MADFFSRYDINSFVVYILVKTRNISVRIVESEMRDRCCLLSWEVFKKKKKKANDYFISDVICFFWYLLKAHAKVKF